MQDIFLGFRWVKRGQMAMHPDTLDKLPQIRTVEGFEQFRLPGENNL